MANLRDIRRRIHSVRNTQQITRAMKMVAAAKLRRAQERVHAARPYSDAMKKMLSSMVSRVNPSAYKLLNEPAEVSHETLIVMAGERGLCGSFNSNVLKAAEQYVQEHGEVGVQVELILVGKKAVDHFARRQALVKKTYVDVFTALKIDHGRSLGEDVVEPFESGRTHAVNIAYNQFISMSRQEPVIRKILPIDAGSFSGETPVEYIYEPDERSILDALLPQYVKFQIWRALTESAAAENAARMTAMEGATRNAAEMIDSLTLVYNRTRQAAITRELIEIVSGAQAL